MSIYTAEATSTDGALIATPCMVIGVYWRATGTGGTIVLDDGGTTLMTIDTPAAVSAGYIPTNDGKGNGIRFLTDLGATLTNADGVTVVYK